MRNLRPYFTLLVVALFVFCFSAPAFSGKPTGPITFGVSGTKTKAGTGFDLYSMGMRNMVFHEDTSDGPAVFAVWQKFHTETGNTSISFAEGWDNGKDWGPEKNISQGFSYVSAPVNITGIYQAGISSTPSIAAIDANKIYVAWSSGSQIVCAYSSNGGVSWNQSLVADSGSPAVLYAFPSIEASPNGDVNIAWSCIRHPLKITFRV